MTEAEIRSSGVCRVIATCPYGCWACDAAPLASYAAALAALGHKPCHRNCARCGTAHGPEDKRDEARRTIL